MCARPRYTCSSGSDDCLSKSGSRSLCRCHDYPTGQSGGRNGCLHVNDSSRCVSGGDGLVDEKKAWLSGMGSYRSRTPLSFLTFFECCDSCKRLRGTCRSIGRVQFTQGDVRILLGSDGTRIRVRLIRPLSSAQRYREHSLEIEYGVPAAVVRPTTVTDYCQHRPPSLALTF